VSRALLAIPIAIVLLAWGSGVLEKHYDADEVSQAHTIWLIAHGQVPYRDFFECHPPFLWYVHVPVLSLLPDRPELLVGLRVISALGCAAWIAALFTAVRASRPGLRSEWLLLAAVLAASHPLVLYYGVEFRPDVWAWAAACAAIARAIRLRSGFRRALELGAAGSLCSLALPKLALLFPAYAGIDLIRRVVARESGIAREIVGYALGIAGAVAAAAGFALAVGIDPLVAWQLAISYHQYVASHFGMPHGLWDEFATDQPSLLVALTGLLAWATWLRARRETPTTLELAVLVTGALQLWLVPFPYVQYTAPVYLLSAIFAPYCGEWAGALATRRRHAPAIVLACACAIAAGIAYRPLAAGWRSGETERYAEVQNAVVRLAPPDQPILVPAPFHPIVRRDAIYGLLRTSMPSGLTTAEVMRRLALPHHDRLGASAIRRELEANRPAVVLFTGQREDFYSDEQTDAIAGYLADHAGEYQRAAGIAPPLWVRGDLVAAAPERPE
jgi:hypothetical protein